ncbi:hypothetical protein ACFLX9_03025 [Chloroflexota bacterium]
MGVSVVAPGILAVSAEAITFPAGGDWHDARGERGVASKRGNERPMWCRFTLLSLVTLALLACGADQEATGSGPSPTPTPTAGVAETPTPTPGRSPSVIIWGFIPPLPHPGRGERLTSVGHHPDVVAHDTTEGSH